MTREQAINYLFSSGFTNEQVGEVVRALTYEPTTKNDLGVDCISRDSAIKALDYDIKCFEFKSGVSRHMDDIAKLLNTIYETQVNNIKALPSVTPQEPIAWIVGKNNAKIAVKNMPIDKLQKICAIIGDEQEPILDKIREEIKVMTSNRGFLSCSVGYIHKEIDNVFDKYKAESEG